MTQAALLGGLFIGVLSALPIINLANCCCLWIVGGGAIAAYLAQQQHPGPFGLTAGARVGFPGRRHRRSRLALRVSRC